MYTHSQRPVLLFAGLALLAMTAVGCLLRGEAVEPATRPDTPNDRQNVEGRQDDQPKNEIVRQLLKRLDEADADPDAVRTVRKMLMEADSELTKGLAGKGRPPASSLTPSPSSRITEKAASPSTASSEKADRAKGPSSATTSSGSKTRIVGALLNVLDEISDADKDAKDSIREALIRADSQLADVLGTKSKERILRANRKPIVRVPVEPKPRMPSQPGEKGKQQTRPTE